MYCTHTVSSTCFIDYMCAVSVCEESTCRHNVYTSVHIPDLGRSQVNVYTQAKHVNVAKFDIKHTIFCIFLPIAYGFLYSECGHGSIRMFTITESLERNTSQHTHTDWQTRGVAMVAHFCEWIPTVTRWGLQIWPEREINNTQDTFTLTLTSIHQTIILPYHAC